MDENLRIDHYRTICETHKICSGLQGRESRQSTFNVLWLPYGGKCCQVCITRAARGDQKAVVLPHIVLCCLRLANTSHSIFCVCTFIRSVIAATAVSTLTERSQTVIGHAPVTVRRRAEVSGLTVCTVCRTLVSVSSLYFSNMSPAVTHNFCICLIGGHQEIGRNLHFTSVVTLDVAD